MMKVYQQLNRKLGVSESGGLRGRTDFPNSLDLIWLIPAWGSTY